MKPLVKNDTKENMLIVSLDHRVKTVELCIRNTKDWITVKFKDVRNVDRSKMNAGDKLRFRYAYHNEVQTR